jgi:proteasome lid subunit RPN8/RPN11
MRFIRDLLTTTALGATLALWACTIALAAEVAAERYDTIEAAAVQALDAITEHAYEVGGVILKDQDGKYYPTPPKGDKDTDGFEIKVYYPKGHKIVAIYHTHPDQGVGEIDGELFSPVDVEIADTMQVPSYIKALRSGTVRKYEPGVHRTRRYKAPGRGTPKGRIADGQVLVAQGPLS